MKTLLAFLLTIGTAYGQCLPTQSLAINDVDTVNSVAAVTICLPNSCSFYYSSLIDLPNRPMLIRIWSTSPMPVRATIVKDCHLVALDSCAAVFETASAGIGFFLWIDNSLGNYDLFLQWSAPNPIFIHPSDHSGAVIPTPYLDTDTLCTSNSVGITPQFETASTYIDCVTGSQSTEPIKGRIYYDTKRKIKIKVMF